MFCHRYAKRLDPRLASITVILLYRKTALIRTLNPGISVGVVLGSRLCSTVVLVEGLWLHQVGRYRRVYVILWRVEPLDLPAAGCTANCLQHSGSVCYLVS